MKKKYIIIMIGAILALLCCTSCSGSTTDSDEERPQVTATPEPLVIQNPKVMEIDNIEEIINEITVKDADGCVIFQCVTDNNVSIKLENKELLVTVPGAHCSCFEE